MARARATRASVAMFDACCTRRSGIARPTTLGFWSAVGMLGVAAVGGTVPIPLYAVYQQAFCMRRALIATAVIPADGPFLADPDCDGGRG